MESEIYVKEEENLGEYIDKFEIGKMMIEGEGGERKDVKDERWLKIEERKGNKGEKEMIGNMMFKEGKKVSGIEMIKDELER